MILALLASLLAGAEQGLLRSVEIWSEHPIRLAIEWLTVDEEGRSTVTAKSLMAVGPPVPIEFTHEPGRYLRFSYEGASPRTYSTTELVKTKRMLVPSVLPGGELLLIAPQAAVRPKELRVEGPLLRTVTLDAASHVSRAGLPAGEYRVVPVYEGGIQGRAREAIVTETASTILIMPVEDVGAVQVEAAPEVCNPATTAGLSRLGPLDPKRPDGPMVRAQIHSTKEPQCWMTFGGLRPGPFEVSYQAHGSTLGRAAFTIETQRVTRANVGPASVTVTGRVTINGNPLPGAQLQFLSTGSGSEGSGAQATSDASGYYRVTLVRPGPFMVRLQRLASVTESKRVELIEGINIVDFPITGGTIVIELVGLTGAQRIMLRLQGPGGNTRTVSWSKAAGLTPTFEGLPPGLYKVAVLGTARDTLESVQTVTVAGPSSVVRLTFELSKR